MTCHFSDSQLDEWRDDLRFYALFNSIFVITGQWMGDNESCVQWNPVHNGKDFCLQGGVEPGTAGSAGQHLTYRSRATGIPVLIGTGSANFV